MRVLLHLLFANQLVEAVLLHRSRSLPYEAIERKHVASLQPSVVVPVQMQYGERLLDAFARFVRVNLRHAYESYRESEGRALSTVA